MPQITLHCDLRHTVKSNGPCTRYGDPQECEVEDMQEQTQSNPSWNGRTVKVIPMSPARCAERIAGAVAWRAFQISQDGGFAPGHAVEDWKRAEAEVVSPLCAGLTMGSDRILVSTSATRFKECAIAICAEPRRLIIFGRRRACAASRRQPGDHSDPQAHRMVDILNLPVEIDPSRVTARFSQDMLEIMLPKVPLHSRAAWSWPRAEPAGNMARGRMIVA